MSRCRKFLLVAFLALLTLELRASALCTLADNLDGGPCCGLTQAVLPLFPGFTQNALDICWRDCGVDWR